MNGFTREGPTDNEVRIIGVELAARDDHGVEHELQMFQCQHTLPADPYGRYRQDNNIRVTLHTNRGDVTLTGTLR